jgi:hypothetical protein
MIATFLTLVVVPTLYHMVEMGRIRAGRAVQWVRQLYWKPFASQKQQ